MSLARPPGAPAPPLLYPPVSKLEPPAGADSDGSTIRPTSGLGIKNPGSVIERCKVLVANFRGIILGCIAADILQINNHFTEFSASDSTTVKVSARLRRSELKVIAKVEKRFVSDSRVPCLAQIWTCQFLSFRLSQSSNRSTNCVLTT